jgi:hypothetical protein
MAVEAADFAVDFGPLVAASDSQPPCTNLSVTQHRPVLALRTGTPYGTCFTDRTGGAHVPPGAVSQGAIGTPAGVVGFLLVSSVRIWFQGYRGRE